MPRYKLAAGIACAVMLGATAVLAVPPAHVAVTQTSFCSDGGGRLWNVRTTWGEVTGGRVAVIATGFNSTAADATTADWSMRTFNADGSVAQVTGGQDTPVSPNTFLERNLANPTTGGARVVVDVGDGNDGLANCTVAFDEPNAALIPAPPAVESNRASPTLTIDPVVAAVGDMVCARGAAVTPATCQHQAVSDRILVDNPAALLALGDLQYEKGTLSAFNTAYNPSYGRLKARTKPVPGNHEYYTSNASGYYDYFGAIAGDRTKGYYSFDIGEWHFLALNSERDTAATGAQVAWLKADLAANTKNCVGAIWHKPRFSTGTEHGDDPAMAPFWDALYAARADLILNGHDHGYERFHPMTPAGVRDDSSGITQIVSGLGGKNRKPVAGRSTTAARTSAVHGYARLVLRPNGTDLSFVPVGGTYTDRTTISCHGDPPGPSVIQPAAARG
jgi:hypothetical protein